MSEVEGTEELNDENTVQAPAEELVDLILTGELHAANQKFNSIIEDKVVESIEEEKHKISQTLFAEDEEEADEGKIPPQFLKGKDKDDDDDDSDDDDEDDSDDDDSDSDDSDSDDDDDDDDDKPKKGKVPPQFMKKEGITGDPEANERAIAHNRAMAKKYGQVRQGIPPEKDKEKKEAVEPVDEISADLAARAGKKAYDDIRDNPSSQKPKLGTTKTAKSDNKRQRQSDKFDTYADRKDYPKQGDTKSTPAKVAGKVGKKSDQQRHTDWRAEKGHVDERKAAPASEEVHSFDPGEASANVELPADSFVQQVADNLAGKRR